MTGATDVRQAAAERHNARPADMATTGGADLAVRADQSYWSAEQLAALSAMGVKGAPEPELRVFLHVAKTTGLDPLLRQLYMIPRWTFDREAGRKVRKWTIQTGIDGFRIVRERAGRRDGWETEFEETIWYDARGQGTQVWLSDDPPFACKVVLVKVLANGQKLRYPALLRTEAYADVDTSEKALKEHPRWQDRRRSQWASDCMHMIEKCCEAFASRRAAPQDLGGLYITEEMQHPERGRQAPTVATVLERDGQPVTEPAEAGPHDDDPDLADQREKAMNRLFAQLRSIGWDGEDEVSAAVRRSAMAHLARERDDDPPLGITSLTQLDAWQAQRAADGVKDFIRSHHGQDTHAALAALAAEVDKQRAAQAQGADKDQK